VDLFAGPGGLGEGFASLIDQGKSSFRIGISIEKEQSAHRTLTLRAFLREHSAQNGSLPKEYIDFHAGIIKEPDWSSIDPNAWKLATEEARQLELGSSLAGEAIDAAITKLRRNFDDTVLIGGPPCQAYSLVGRARSRGTHGYVPEDDNRHYLFREYIRVLDRLRPAAFVLENVKGMLSSTVESRLVFEMLIEDLSSLGNRSGALYELRAIRVEGERAFLNEVRQPSDFIVRTEDFGVPQRRHRVIIVGIRKDLKTSASTASVKISGKISTVEDAIGDLPVLRSGLSRGNDNQDDWLETVIAAAKKMYKIHKGKNLAGLRTEFSALVQQLEQSPAYPRESSILPKGYGTYKSDLLDWLERPGLSAIAQHETRGHMASDLGRYLFASVFGKVKGYSPKAIEYPKTLSPDHRNWHTGVFNDRFRVQLASDPSTTITSHISKDGHYFIHPDPSQCRSLTVREAARLQTFPDDYFFLGNRTQQYVQVGNAVPPYLAKQIALLLRRALP